MNLIISMIFLHMYKDKTLKFAENINFFIINSFYNINSNFIILSILRNNFTERITDNRQVTTLLD